MPHIKKIFKKQNNWNEKYTIKNQQQNKWGRWIGKQAGKKKGVIIAINQSLPSNKILKNTEKKWEQIRDLWDNIKSTNICIIGVSKKNIKGV